MTGLFEVVRVFKGFCLRYVAEDDAVRTMEKGVHLELCAPLDQTECWVLKKGKWTVTLDEMGVVCHSKGTYFFNSDMSTIRGQYLLHCPEDREAAIDFKAMLSELVIILEIESPVSDGEEYEGLIKKETEFTVHKSLFNAKAAKEAAKAGLALAKKTGKLDEKTADDLSKGDAQAIASVAGKALSAATPALGKVGNTVKQKILPRIGKTFIGKKDTEKLIKEITKVAADPGEDGSRDFAPIAEAAGKALAKTASKAATAALGPAAGFAVRKTVNYAGGKAAKGVEKAIKAKTEKNKLETEKNTLETEKTKSEND